MAAQLTCSSKPLLLALKLTALQARQQQASIKALCQDCQTAAGALEGQIRLWQGAAAKLDRGLRAAGDVENLLASVEEDVVQVADLLTQLARLRQSAAAHVGPAASSSAAQPGQAHHSAG